MPQGARRPGANPAARETHLSGQEQREDTTADKAATALPIARGTDGLRRRIEQREPPLQVVVFVADLRIPPDRDPRRLLELHVLELTGGADPDMIDWRIVEGLDVTIVEDQLPGALETIAEALAGAGASIVRRTTLDTVPRWLR